MNKELIKEKLKEKEKANEKTKMHDKALLKVCIKKKEKIVYFKTKMKKYNY